MNRQGHHQEVRSFLQKHLSIRDLTLSLPRGSGMETYFVQADGRQYFAKVGASMERYLIMADLSLTPRVLCYGQLDSGISIIIQPFIIGRRPSQKDYQDQLEKVAGLIRQMHNHPQIQRILPPAPSNLHKDAGLQALNHLRRKWERYQAQVPNLANFVDNSLEDLAQQINLFSTQGLVASHGDICNANWLFASNGEIYIIDLESMSLDDPASDMGALLWWYYPPELRGRFLDIAGYRYDQEFKFRMQVRMAMHCLNITLPREGSFDRFDPRSYNEALDDFRAVLNGEENPQGYSK